MRKVGKSSELLAVDNTPGYEYDANRMNLFMLKIAERNSMKFNASAISMEELWDVIRENQGKRFLTKKGLPFTYSIKGGELFTDRRERSITRSTFEKAYEKLRADRAVEDGPARIVGPKTLNVYGAPYIWAVFMGIGLIEEEMQQQELDFSERN